MTTKIVALAICGGVLIMLTVLTFVLIGEGT